MTKFICLVCSKPGDLYDQEKIQVQGILENDLHLDDLDIEIESARLSDIEYIYYYFEEKDLNLILQSHNAAGRPREMCIDCLHDSIENTLSIGDPHYGDGVYVTLHQNLKDARAEVKSAHGRQVAERQYRVKYQIINKSYLKKINRTAGVCRTIEDKRNATLIFLNNDDREVVKYRGIEKYEGGEWIAI